MCDRILILGIGNPLMGDEGVGVRVAELLMRHYTLPESVEIVDAGTMGLGMISLFRGVDMLVVVDAIDKTGHPPGTVVRLTPESLAPNQVMHSLHDIRFIDVLGAAELIGLRPHAECVGIQIDTIQQWQTELSPQVECALPIAVDAVLDILTSQGIVPIRLDNETRDAAVIESLRNKTPLPDG